MTFRTTVTADRTGIDARASAARLAAADWTSFRSGADDRV
jgi:hypothetical protein